MLPRQAVTSIGDTAFRRAGLTDICYGGTEDQWKAIKIGQYNESLNKANIHYNSPIQEQPGTTTTPAAGRFTDYTEEAYPCTVLPTTTAKGLIPGFFRP